MNEMIEKENVSLEIVEDNPIIFNANVGNEPRKLQIKTTQRVNATTKKPFTSASVLMNLDVYDIEGNFLGHFNRWVDLKFREEAWKNKESTSNVENINDLSLGFLYVRAKGIQAPRVYKPRYKKDKDTKEIVYDKNGEAIIEYPEVWIKSGIIGFEQYVSSQDNFDYQAPIKEAQIEEKNVDSETGEIKN